MCQLLAVAGSSLSVAGWAEVPDLQQIGRVVGSGVEVPLTVDDGWRRGSRLGIDRSPVAWQIAARWNGSSRLLTDRLVHAAEMLAGR